MIAIIAIFVTLNLIGFVAASAAGKRHDRHWYHWAWQEWMPQKWQRIGACETGFGRRPGNFHWDSGRYVSFAGIYRPAYRQFAHEIRQRDWDETRARGRYPTPREQLNVALAIYRRYGYGAWGCGGA